MARKHGFQWPLDPHQVGLQTPCCASQLSRAQLAASRTRQCLRAQVGAILVFSGLAAGCYAFQLVLVEDRTAYIVLVVLYTLLVATVLALDISCRWGSHVTSAP